MNKIEDEGFILHKTPYRNTSLLLDVLTKKTGRVRLLAKGFRKARLDIFTHLWLSFIDKSALGTLCSIETLTPTYTLKQYALISGLYLNELLVRLLPIADANTKLFLLYERTLSHLTDNACLDVKLRHFEKILLEQLGYGLVLDVEAQTNEAIQENDYYTYEAGTGFIKLDANTKIGQHKPFLGCHLLAINNNQWQDKQIRTEAKRLMRMSFDYLLEGRPLISRTLFI